ncbi:hypothetical protein Y1Q_0012933 [Alligator mississippiensis]|uniref:Uncharacterized protein n=1 Tax=Alligator mississippiensis TaxID=8496 RepID=A0A151P2T9_ALLMI|nr:hypothetical protein Y1Q_0012933 [Alligator mississippiensis]
MQWRKAAVSAVRATPGQQHYKEPRKCFGHVRQEEAMCLSAQHAGPPCRRGTTWHVSVNQLQSAVSPCNLCRYFQTTAKS